MKEFLTIDRQANAIRMRRSAFNGSFLLVEGHSDKLFYQRFVDQDQCELFESAGKPSSKFRAIKILEILEKSKFQGVLAIVDADCDRLNNISRDNQNLFFTDSHDLETMIIKSSALDKVVVEFGSEEKIQKFKQKQDIRAALLDLGSKIGYLRWISQTEKLNLTFNSIELSKFISQKTLEIDETKLFQEVKNKSQNQSLQNETIKQLLTDKRNKQNDLWQVCCGHDLVKILSLALLTLLGSNQAAEIKPEILERSLRLAYEKAYFTETNLYQDVCVWESKNQPFNVFTEV